MIPFFPSALMSSKTSIDPSNLSVVELRKMMKEAEAHKKETADMDVDDNEEVDVETFEESKLKKKRKSKGKTEEEGSRRVMRSVKKDVEKKTNDEDVCPVCKLILFVEVSSCYHEQLAGRRLTL
jgi:hypothetical protein